MSFILDKKTNNTQARKTHDKNQIKCYKKYNNYLKIKTLPPIKKINRTIHKPEIKGLTPVLARIEAQFKKKL